MRELKFMTVPYDGETGVVLYVDTGYGYMCAIQYSICLPTFLDTSVKLNPKYSVTLHHAVK